MIKVNITYFRTTQMCRGRGAVVFCPGGRLVFQRSWGGSDSEEPAERNLASVSCHRWLLSESARISLCVVRAVP